MEHLHIFGCNVGVHTGYKHLSFPKLRPPDHEVPYKNTPLSLGMVEAATECMDGQSDEHT